MFICSYTLVLGSLTLGDQELSPYCHCGWLSHQNVQKLSRLGMYESCRILQFACKIFDYYRRNSRVEWKLCWLYFSWCTNFQPCCECVSVFKPKYKMGFIAHFFSVVMLLIMQQENAAFITSKFPVGRLQAVLLWPGVIAEQWVDHVKTWVAAEAVICHHRCSCICLFHLFALRWTSEHVRIS